MEHDQGYSFHALYSDSVRDIIPADLLGALEDNVVEFLDSVLTRLQLIERLL